MDLVREALGGELGGELAAAEGDQVPAVLALEAGHALGQVALDQRRVPLEGFLEGPGSDILGDTVHPLSEAGVVGDGGPDAGEALVDLTPEQERVRGQELIELVPLALALEDRPVLGRRPDDAIDGDVGRDDQLSHGTSTVGPGRLPDRAKPSRGLFLRGSRERTEQANGIPWPNLVEEVGVRLLDG